MRSVVPVVDLFAGPGGLGEGFASFIAEDRARATFKIAISIEKDFYAHQTLELRSFYRKFVYREVPDEYYDYLRGELSREELFAAWPNEARAARKEARLAELGSEDDEDIYEWIEDALSKRASPYWVLIGGPPCQAYSTIGRSRRRADPTFATDEKHFLYREYLEIIVRYHPTVFVMENVKGLLSAKVNGKPIFNRILRDLRRPSIALKDKEQKAADTEGPQLEQAPPEYQIYSLVVEAEEPSVLAPTNYVIEAEKYGIPQTRHRVILLGVRSTYTAAPGILDQHPVTIPACSVLNDFPPLRSCLSKNQSEAGLRDSAENWRRVIASVLTRDWFARLEDSQSDLFAGQLRTAMEAAVHNLQVGAIIGDEYVSKKVKPQYRPDWYHDPCLEGICNYTARAHMGEDLHRYLFAACYAQVYGSSPKMRDFPTALLPQHQNIQHSRQTGAEEDFDDRFRVQVADRPATTITSHISKDGHYNIHYDPTQCRSLTVREAARLQTFPDNYFFEGPRTQQYLQVGNAVPPLLAYQIASVVHYLFEEIHASER